MHGLKEAIRDYVETNHYSPTDRSGFRTIAGVQCVRMAAGAEIRVGDFVYYYSSMLDAFSVDQILDVNFEAKTLMHAEIDTDSIIDTTAKTSNFTGCNAPSWWALTEAGEWYDTECMTLWRPVSREEAARVSTTGFRSAYIPFGPYTRGPEQRVLHPVYGPDPNVVEMEVVVPQLPALEAPKPQTSRWKRWFSFLN